MANAPPRTPDASRIGGLSAQKREPACQPVLPDQRMGVDQVHAEGQRRDAFDKTPKTGADIQLREAQYQSHRRQQDGGRGVRCQQHLVAEGVPSGPSTAGPLPDAPATSPVRSLHKSPPGRRDGGTSASRTAAEHRPAGRDRTATGRCNRCPSGRRPFAAGWAERKTPARWTAPAAAAVPWKGGSAAD